MPFGRSIAWDAEVISDEQTNAVSWRSSGETVVPNVRAVYFRPSPTGHGTEVLVRIEYNLPLGSLGTFMLKLFGLAPGLQAEDALRAFKEFQETGERPMTLRQSRGGIPTSRVDRGLEIGWRVLDAGGTVVGRRKIHSEVRVA